MDQRLVAWARAVKSRRAKAGAAAIPPLWLFTDPRRMPDLVAVVAGLPKGLCGVVFRHDGVDGRAALGRRLARLCRDRRLLLVSTRPGGPVEAPHLRRGRGIARGSATGSAHGVVELVRCGRAGVAATFLSSAFPTGSHPGTAALGPVRWAALARYARRGDGAILALGGIDGRTARRLPRWVAGAGAIGALAG